MSDEDQDSDTGSDRYGFNEDPLLCPVAALVEYDQQVIPVQVISSSCINSLFMCPCQPMKERRFLSHFVHRMLMSQFRLSHGGFFPY